MPGNLPDDVTQNMIDAHHDGSAYGYEPPEPEDEWPKCPTCKGRGLVNPLTAPEGFFCVGTTDCPTCDGSGDCP